MDGIHNKAFFPDSYHNLIINTDDFCWNPYRDSGILELFEKKLISSASVLINGCNRDFISEILRKSTFFKEKERISIGIHINLTEGIPVKNDVKNNSLTKKGFWKTNSGIAIEKEQGEKAYETEIFHGKYEFFQLMSSNLIKKEDIFKEIQAQVGFFSIFLCFFNVFLKKD